MTYFFRNSAVWRPQRLISFHFSSLWLSGYWLLATVSLYVCLFKRFFSCVIDLTVKWPWRAIAHLASSLLVHPHWWGFKKSCYYLNWKWEQKWCMTHKKTKAGWAGTCKGGVCAFKNWLIERERERDGEWRQSSFVALVAGTQPGNCRWAAWLQPPYIT